MNSRRYLELGEERGRGVSVTRSEIAPPVLVSGASSDISPAPEIVPEVSLSESSSEVPRDVSTTMVPVIKWICVA
jgi:hypothetical protein